MTSLGRGDNPETTKSTAPAQENNYPAPEAFPTLFELVAQNVEAPMRRAAVYLVALDEFRRLGDIEGFCESCAEFLNAGREIAKHLALLKIPKVFSNELADQLEEKAREIHNLADLTDMQASRIRSVVTL